MRRLSDKIYSGMASSNTHLKGTVRVPGDKSISHRAVILASIAEGVSRIANFAPGTDCGSTLRCMRQLGVGIERSGNDALVHGVGKFGLKGPSELLDCGNSGTTMRLLAGLLAGQPFRSVLTGDGSLKSRPMARIIEPLSQMGAKIDSNNGFAPLTIDGAKLVGIRYETPVPSAQVKSSVLLAGLYAEGQTSVSEAVPTRDHTERMLASMGVRVETPAAGECRVSGDAELRAHDIEVPGDISSAAFFIAAAAALPGSELLLENVGVNPKRAAILDVFRDLGVDLSIAERSGGPEPAANVTVRAGLAAASRTMIAGPDVAAVIDEIPILAVLGTQLEQGLEVRDAGELRVKESDRISAIVEGSRRMGAEVEEFSDGFRVGRSQLRGASVDSRGDHRIAMAFAVAALIADGETHIEKAECVDVSYPGFFEQLATVTR